MMVAGDVSSRYNGGRSAADSGYQLGAERRAAVSLRHVRVECNSGPAAMRPRRDATDPVSVPKTKDGGGCDASDRRTPPVAFDRDPLHPV